MGRRRDLDCRCAPPTPVLYNVSRMFYVEPIEDYEELSGYTWTAGTTGEKLQSGTPVSGTNFNCHYIKISQVTWLTTDIKVLQPLRFKFVAPTADGGNYDHMAIASHTIDTYQYQWAPPHRIQHIDSLYGGWMGAELVPNDGISTKLLASGTNSEFYDGYTVPRIIWAPVASLWNRGYAPNLLPSGEYYNTNLMLGVYAIRHRVNGAFVGAVKTNLGAWSLTNTKWFCDINEEDTYELDVWYAIYPQVNISGAGPSLLSPTTACVVAQTTNVDTGSRRDFIATRGKRDSFYGPIPGGSGKLTFYNVNIAKFFDKTLHTYEVTLNGSMTWTQYAGSNGPFKVENVSGNWAATIGDAGFIFTRVAIYEGDIYIKQITLSFLNEIAYISLLFGRKLKATLGVDENWVIKALYRIPSNSHYINNVVTNNADTPSAIINPQGKWTTQAGTTTFYLCPSTVELPTVTSFGYDVVPGFNAYKNTVAVPHSEIPASVTIKRVNQ